MEQLENALLRHLHRMPAQAIYALADKEHLFNGFELCKRNPVSGLRWSGDGSVLTLDIADGAAHRVTLRLVHGELSSSCDCGVWSPRGRCPHLVASLATLKKALAPSSFPMLQLSEAYLEQLRGELLVVASGPVPPEETAPAAVEARYSLVIDRDGESFRMRLMHDDAEVTLLDAALPPSIREFLRLMQSCALRGRCIEEFLARFRGRFPICFAGPDLLLPLSFEGSVQHVLLLQLDLRRGEAAVKLSLGEEVSLDRDSFVFQGYHFDLRRGTIAKTDDASALFYDRLLAGVENVPGAEVVREDDGFRFPAGLFNAVKFTLPRSDFDSFLARTALSVRNVRVRPRELRPRYRLNVTDLGETVRAVVEGVAEGVVFTLAPDTFRLFSAAGRTQLPQPLKAKKRVAYLVKGSLAALSGAGRSERERIVRQLLDTPDFFKRGLRSAARELISGFCEAASEPAVMLQLSEDGDWLAVDVEGERQGRLLQIAAEFFGAVIFFEAQEPGEMLIERSVLMKQLSRFCSVLAGEEFSLAVGGEELKTVSWSFTLDATRSSIDWFELRPEVTWEGEPVDEAELLQALQGGGIFRRDGRMVILDEQSAGTLSLFTHGGKREVVRVPRLQILDWIALRRVGVRVILSPEDERIFESLTRFEEIALRPPPAGLQATLRKYQVEGYSWLAFLYEHRFGACLADDMGLGKTIQAIALLAGLKEGLIRPQGETNRPHLVVVPPTLIFNWESEFARFYPSLKVGVYRGQGRRADFSTLDVVLTSYGVVQRDIETLGEIPFHVVVFDEAQAVKNIHTETTGAVRRLKGNFKVALTGTPVENHLGEYYSVMDLALPGLLGGYEQFRRGTGRDDGFMETLLRRTHPFILRRSKDMIAGELPPKVETDIYLEMSPRQKALYARTVAKVKETVAQAFTLNAPGQARIIALTAILKLRQICLSSKLVLAGAADRSPKIEFLVDQLQELFDEGHSVLVFSQFTSFLDIVEEGLRQHGIASSRLDGSTPVSKRKELVQNFQESQEPGVFLLSLKAGGRGLNLTRASYVFHLDPWWNPAVENQASDRAHRIGQKRQVTITRLLMRHSIEEKMMELKKRKLKLYRAILESAEHEGAGAISREDFEFLLG